VGIDSGTRLGAYVLGERIGRGGMGVVYRATHVQLGREVALKVLAPELSGDADFRARFLRESRLAASLDHANAVTVYDAGEADGTLYIAMRFVDGTDLAKLIRNHRPLDPELTLSMLDQVGAALDAAHGLGLIHRDVKPANVLVSGAHCYLTDFGLSKRASATETSAALTRTGQFLGTIDYVAPEQIEGGEIDARADIYALTCILHECLTGSRPYPKNSDVAIISAHLYDPPPRPTELLPALPPAIDDVVARGMAKDPGDRYRSCAELLAAAHEALGVAAPPGAAQRADGPVATAGRSAIGSSVASTSAPSAAGDAAPAAMETRARSERRGRKRIVIGGVAAACVAAVAVVAILSSGGTNNSGTTSAAAGRQTATAGTSSSRTAAHAVGEPIQVGSEPTGIDGSASVLWIANFGGSTVSRVTPDGKIRTDIKLGRAPFAVLRIGGTFWVSSTGSGTVTPISVATGLPGKPVAVGNKPEWLAGDENALFVSSAASDTLSVVNPRTDTLIGSPINVGSVPRGIAFSGSAVWVAASDNDKVDRIVDGHVVKSITVGRRPIGVAFGANAIWVANELDNTVSRIDLSEDTVKAIRVGKAPFAVAFGLGSAWVTNSGDNTVTRLDGSTGDPVGNPIAVGHDPTGIAVIGQAVWVTNRGSNTVQEIAP
jgi:YVTN family beta-propeller protein